MRAGDGDLDRALGIVLAADFGKIDVVILVTLEKLRHVLAGRLQLPLAGQKFESLAQIAHAEDLDPLDHRGLTGIRLGHDDGLPASRAGLDRDGQHAFHRTHLAGQRELADEGVFLHVEQLGFHADRDHRQRDRQVEARPFLFYIRGRQVDCRPAMRPVVAAVRDCRRHTVAAFLDRDIRQSDDDDRGHAGGGIDFDLDLEGFHAINGGRINFCQHGSATLSDRKGESKRLNGRI